MVEFSRSVPTRKGPPVVALGGGHGLSVTLRALRRITDDVTAVVGVADDGGSSGRLRDELGVVPPGDLRMALAALCGDDAWGKTWSRVMQHRFGGDGEIAGHATGNILIAALWEETGGVVEGLDWAAALLGAHGRVLPVSTEPLEIVAEVRGAQESQPDVISVVRGQVALEETLGEVLALAVSPEDPPACPEAVEALVSAEAIVLGPGSWYTSVLPHLLVPGVRQAVRDSSATRVLVLNLSAGKGDNHGFRSHDYLRVWNDHFADVKLDFVLADDQHVDDLERLDQYSKAMGATLVTSRLTANRDISDDVAHSHDAQLLAGALAELLGRGNISVWQ